MLVYCQMWTESECGWGQRNDGFSIHRTHTALENYIKNYWKQTKRLYGENPPEEYSFPDGKPQLIDLRDRKIQAALRKNDSYRSYSKELPTHKEILK